MAHVDVNICARAAYRNENLEGHFVIPHWTSEGDNATLLQEIGSALKER